MQLFDLKVLVSFFRGISVGFLYIWENCTMLYKNKIRDSVMSCPYASTTPLDAYCFVSQVDTKIYTLQFGGTFFYCEDHHLRKVIHYEIVKSLLF
jgi:hypothetical protein